jgi:surface antigen
VRQSSADQSVSQSLATENLATSSGSSDPLDQVSSADIALQAAQMTGIYQTTAVSNQVDSESAQLNVVASDNQLITKPQVVATAIKSNENIMSYTVQPGDTLASLATKFGLTASSIEWSNNLTGLSSLTAGEVLTIPPVNGIVYKVKAGDTASTLAASYGASASQITSFNNAEISGLVPGQSIVIPNGVVKTVNTASYSSSSSSLNSNYSFGYTPIYGYNGYDFGYCTWYVASQIAVPSNWGDASTWAAAAAASGWNVSPNPTVGSIAQTPYAAGGQGHVAIVTAVSADGSTIQYKDMNNYGDGGGWDKVGYSGWAPTSTFLNYITR